MQLQKCKEELQVLQQLRDTDTIQLHVLEAKLLAAEQSAAEHLNLRSKQEACNTRLKGDLVER